MYINDRTKELDQKYQQLNIHFKTIWERAAHKHILRKLDSIKTTTPTNNSQSWFYRAFQYFSNEKR